VTGSMRISVAMTTRDSQRFLEPALASLAGQIRPPDELVVHDDASRDATVPMLEEFARRAPFLVRIERAPQQRGFVEGFVRAARASSGDLVAFCDADDVWLEQKLEVCGAALERSGAQVALHTVRVVGADLSEIASRWPAIDAPRVVPPLGLTGLGVEAPGMAMVFRRELLDLFDFADRPHSRFDPTRPMLHDEWTLFTAGVVGTVALIDEPLVLYRQHEDNLTGWVRRDRQRTLEPALDDYRRAYEHCAACADYLERAHAGDHQTATRVAAGAAHYREAADNWRLRLSLYGAHRRLTRARIIGRLVAAGAYGQLSARNFGRAALGKDLVAGLALSADPGRPAARDDAADAR
jgi:glycosyltransferase involved in cell wall biosynthesis